MQGDIIGIYDEDGNKVGAYIYDAWGNTTIVTDIGGIASANPFRYRSYYYDSDIGLYYLKSRYYDAKVGRFINADGIEYLGANGDICAFNLFAYCSDNPVMRTDENGFRDYIYTSRSEYYIENDRGMWEFLHGPRYYAEIDGVRYLVNSKETVTLYDWNSLDKNFLDETLDSLVNSANIEETNIGRVLSQSIGGDLDFKLQLAKEKLYLANGILYNRNEAGNFVWTYFLESHGFIGDISGLLAQAGSLVSPIVGMNGLPRLDEEWDRKARWAGIEYYYTRNNITWLYYIMYGLKLHI